MNDFLPSGRFVIGANYWASHSGVLMWRDWRPEIIEEDFRLLSASGLQVLRIFPLWPDFQPIQMLNVESNPREFRWGEDPLPDDERIQSGVSPVMLERFGIFCDLAAKHGLELIVGLITGWMSGRLFVPPGLERLSPITDPRSQMWQIRLARAIVSRFQGHSAIKAWDLGNECNVMDTKATREQAWMWTSGLADAIRSLDSTRPVISGMHSLAAEEKGWTIRDQGELTDILTTHPYPLFTPHCNREPMTAMRPILHGTAETCLYADLGGRPAFVEEFGNLGPMVCGETETAAFMRTTLASLWAHDLRGALWWCAHDQTALTMAPYDWTVLERELGLMREDRSAKPVLTAMGDFRKTLESLPFEELPPRRVEAVCVLTLGQDHWGVAYSAFVLAKRAGFDLRFHYADRSLPDSSLYLLPSIAGMHTMTRRLENELWEKVRAGATVYISLGDGMLGKFGEAAGVEVETRSERLGGCSVTLPGGAVFEFTSALDYRLHTRTAEVLGTEADGRPFFWKNKLGKGQVFVLCAPLEGELATMPQAFADGSTTPFHEFYRTFAAPFLAERALQKSNPRIGITEHAFPDGSIAAILINYSARPAEDTLILRKGWRITDSKTGQEIAAGSAGECRIELPANDWAIWRLSPPSK